MIKTKLITPRTFNIQYNIERMNVMHKQRYSEELEDTIHSINVPNWEVMKDYPEEAITYFKSKVKDVTDKDGKEFQTVISTLSWTADVDWYINKFLESNHIDEDNLIDIKYQIAAGAEAWIDERALIIWRASLHG